LNKNSFDPITFWNIVGGIRFDLMTISIIYSPFIISHLILFKGKAKISKYLFHFSNTISILLNCIDFEYYKFTFKRTTSDLFTTDGMASDVLTLVPQFLQDFWYIGIIIIILIYLAVFLYKKTEKIKVESIKPIQVISFIIPVLILVILGGRGGTQLRPLGVLSASQYASGKNVPIVLNTPFTILKSSYKEDLKELSYYSLDEINQAYNPIQFIRKDSLTKKLNVVLIIAESFSKEYIGAYNAKSTFTPFLDSLIKESLSFEFMFANGKKSIEALPAILSGIPTLMNNSYVSSKYSSNRIESIASSLKKQGYQSAFYHGGTNGTMGFNSYTQIAGFDRYIGLDEYPNKRDHDGSWGIFDEPFLQFCIEDINNHSNPFFASIFTLSSHHPYTIPTQHKGKFKEGPLPILQSISYADYALQRFFETAKKQSWFDETVFIITADHTSHSITPEYSSRVGIYETPLIFYSPKYIQAKRDSSLVQQTDIFPSLIDFLGMEEEFVSFGQSFFQESSDKFSISYLNEIYQFIQGDFSLQFDGKKSVGLYKFKTDRELKNNLLKSDPNTTILLENKLKAILQQYNSKIINNQLIIEND
jgi:phosphoglycerol transferase MdoB-like AlkP superfamily enzyme